MILVIDASIAVKWFVQEPLRGQAFDLIVPEISRNAPDLIFSEVGNALWSKMRRGEILSNQARFAIESLAGFFDRIIPSQDIATRAFEIAEALGHPIYDCFYLACAEAVTGTVITADARLRSAAATGGFGHLIEALDQSET